MINKNTQRIIESIAPLVSGKDTIQYGLEISYDKLTQFHHILEGGGLFGFEKDTFVKT